MLETAFSNRSAKCSVSAVLIDVAKAQLITSRNVQDLPRPSHPSSKDATNVAKGIATNGARTLLGALLALLLGASLLLITRSYE